MQATVRPQDLDVESAEAWEIFWSHLDRLVSDMQSVLRHHLGDAPIAAKRIGAQRLAGEATVRFGPARFRVFLPFVATAPSPEEDGFARAFGRERRVLRLFILDESAPAGSRPRPRARVLLAIDPLSGSWVAENSDEPPRPLSDRWALERVLLPLFG